MHYHQTATNQTRVNELKIISCYKYELTGSRKGISKLVNLKIMFDWLLEESKFTADTKSSMQVTRCTAAMQNLNTSYMHSSFFCRLLTCHHCRNASDCSKNCN